MTTTIGPVDGLDYHVALGYYPEDSVVARWDSARWEPTGTSVNNWAGPAPLDDVSCDVVSVRIARGRDLPLERFRPASLRVEVDDREGKYSPWTNAPDPEAYATIRPGIEVVVWIDDGTTETTRFVGIVDSIEDSFPDAETHRVTFQAYDSLAVLAAYDGVEQAAQGAGELPGARLGRIADNAGAYGPRDFDSGSVTLQATTLAKNALDEMGLVTDTETGDLFAERDGTLRFVDRTGLISDSRYTDVQATFGDLDPEICYTAIKLASDLSKVKNLVSISNVGGTAVTVADATSISLYRARTFRRFDLIHEDPAESTIIANRHLAFYAFAVNRVETLTVDLSTLTPAQRATVLALDLLWRIQVRRRPPGLQIVADLQVEAIGEDVTASTWTLTFKTFSADAVFAVARWNRDVWNSGLWGY